MSFFVRTDLPFRRSATPHPLSPLFSFLLQRRLPESNSEPRAAAAPPAPHPGPLHRHPPPHSVAQTLLNHPMRGEISHPKTSNTFWSVVSQYFSPTHSDSPKYCGLDTPPRFAFHISPAAGHVYSKNTTSYFIFKVEGFTATIFLPSPRVERISFLHFTYKRQYNKIHAHETPLFLHFTSKRQNVL